MSSTENRIAVHPASQTAGANVLNIASGKGGVGKTWLAISLSQAIARQGKQVLLFDGDLGLANVDIQLGLNVERDLGAVIANNLNLSEVVTRCPDGGFDLVAGRSGSGALADLDRQWMRRLQSELWTLSRAYDRVIIDLGAGIEANIRALTPKGGTTLVVVNDEPTSLTDGYAYIKVTRARNPDADLRIVVNLAKDRSQGERTYETIAKACKNFLKVTPPLAGVIRRDDRVADAIRRQTPFLSRYPECDTARDLAKLAAKLNP
jgi:flagellar biosynthesis protein FlhG